MEGKNDSRLVISYQSKHYDLTKFQHKHPGGINTLKGLNNTDIKHRFEKAPPHSNAALYLMKEYEIDVDKETNNNENLKNGIGNGTSNGVVNGTETNKNGNLKIGIKNGNSNGAVKSKDINSNTIQHKIDESMEVSMISPNREIVI